LRFALLYIPIHRNPSSTRSATTYKPRSLVTFRAAGRFKLM